MTNYENVEHINGFVGVNESGAYVFLDKVFEHGDGLHGATGTMIVPVTEEFVNERVEELKDYEWSPIAHLYDEEDTSESWEEWIDNFSRRELEELVIDPSGGQYWDTVKEVAEEQEVDFYMTDCIGGGRIFGGKEGNPENYELLNPEFLDIAKEAENGEFFE